MFGLLFKIGTAVKNFKIPKNTDSASKLLQITNRDDFIEYVACPKCHSIYHYEDCFYVCHGQKESKACNHIPNPNHPHHSRRVNCGAILLKKVKTGRGYKLVPNKVYPYQPLSKSLTYLIQKEGFLDSCEMWRNRVASDTHLIDIYDGRVWSEYQTHGFLQSPFCYLLTLNIDWFQPFTHIEYSIGAIYLAIQNLPRSERFKEENIILAGVLPGPSEPKLSVNSYLGPLVEDLKTAWYNGIKVKRIDGSEIKIRLAVTCIACDIPASRKLCGFLGHNATLGCNKCLKKFNSTSFGVVDYSGYNRELWEPRNSQLHREQCREILAQNTETGMRKYASQYGLRYSTLLLLPYFDPVRFTIVDVMHNLFLGTGKHMFKLWLSLDLLTKENLSEMEEMISTFCVPNYIGRLPINISSNYGGYTAAQWQSWITLYSPVVLKDMLPSEHYQCWLLFVRACSLLSRRVISKNDITTADLLLLNFCEKHELLYGKETCTPNLHLHLHLKDCLLDYGPSHTFWCFAFERVNGILGSFHTNKKAAETQIMRKFINAQKLCGAKLKANSELVSTFDFRVSTSATSQLTSTVAGSGNCLEMLNLSLLPPDQIPTFQHNSSITMLPPFHQDIFSAELLKDLELFYKMLYPTCDIEIVSSFFVRCGRVTLYEQVIGSVMNSRCSKSSSVITAYWPTTGSDFSSIDYSMRMSVGTVQYFCKHRVVLCTVDNVKRNADHVIAYVKWNQKHPHAEWYGLSATVCSDMHEPPSVCSFIPVQRIYAVCAHCMPKIQMGTLYETVFIAIPIPTRFCF